MNNERGTMGTEPRHGVNVAVFTWGYERRDFQALVDVVAGCRVDVVVDIRMNPFSRRVEWRRTALEENLGRRYWCIEYFGNANHKSGGAPRLVAPEAGLREFRKMLHATGAKTVLLLCYERDAATCHRTLVADLLRDELGQANGGVTVEHLP